MKLPFLKVMQVASIRIIFSCRVWTQRKHVLGGETFAQRGDDELIFGASLKLVIEAEFPLSTRRSDPLQTVYCLKLSD